MICPKCNANIDDRSYYCNRCGAAQTPQDAQSQPEPQNRYASQDAERYGPREYRSDQPPPAKGFDFGGLNEKKYLILSLVCFGWAAVRGIPAIIVLLRVVIEGFSFWDRFNGFNGFGLVSAIVSVGIHVAAPLILGGVLLKKYHEDIPR